MEKSQKKYKKKNLGSYPFFNVIMSITLAMFIIGLLGTIVLHVSALKTNVQKNIEIQVLLSNTTSDGQKNKIEKVLIGKPFLAFDQNNDPLIEFVSKSEGADAFKEDIEFLGYNPLPDILLFKIKPEYQQKDSLTAMKAELESLTGVTEVYYEPDFIEAINEKITKIALFLSVCAFVFLLAVVILINNTIKLALFSQRFLIRSMQLVGAKSWFIKKPFLTRALLHGALGATIALLLLWFSLQYSYTKIDQLSQLYNPFYHYILAATLVGFGCIIGFFATLRAINKYLKLSLDELY